MLIIWTVVALTYLITRGHTVSGPHIAPYKRQQVFINTSGADLNRRHPLNFLTVLPGHVRVGAMVALYPKPPGEDGLGIEANQRHRRRTVGPFSNTVYR